MAFLDNLKIIGNRRGEFSFEVLIGIVIAVIVLLVLLRAYGLIKTSVEALPG